MVPLENPNQAPTMIYSISKGCLPIWTHQSRQIGPQSLKYCAQMNDLARPKMAAVNHVPGNGPYIAPVRSWLGKRYFRKRKDLFERRYR